MNIFTGSLLSKSCLHFFSETLLEPPQMHCERGNVKRYSFKIFFIYYNRDLHEKSLRCNAQSPKLPLGSFLSAFYFSFQSLSLGLIPSTRKVTPNYHPMWVVFVPVWWQNNFFFALNHVALNLSLLHPSNFKSGMLYDKTCIKFWKIMGKLQRQRRISNKKVLCYEEKCVL